MLDVDRFNVTSNFNVKCYLPFLKWFAAAGLCSAEVLDGDEETQNC